MSQGLARGDLRRKEKYTETICGDNSEEETPVPIPNTEVKLLSADDTWWETAWESKTLPLIYFKNQLSFKLVFFKRYIKASKHLSATS